MQLTKEQAIAEHRKMWNWIAEQNEKGKVFLPLKQQYLKQFFPNETVFSDCFCCEYGNFDGHCSECPLDWDSNVEHTMCMDKYREDDDQGLYMQWVCSMRPEKAAILARRIANLPEKTR